MYHCNVKESYPSYLWSRLVNQKHFETALMHGNLEVFKKIEESMWSSIASQITYRSPIYLIQNIFLLTYIYLINIQLESVCLFEEKYRRQGVTTFNSIA
jgi:hypothetical protein